MKIRLIRHATCVIIVNGYKIMLDPMLSPAGTLDPIANVPNPSPNPLVDLPDMDNLLQELDAVIVTHTHRDHFDNRAMELLPKNRPLFCQPQDTAKITAAGFTDVRPVASSIQWQGITIHRTEGQHGTGAIGARMAPVSGFVITAPDEPNLYITGDTIYCSEVAEALKTYQPDLVLAFAGGAQFQEGDPITMGWSDLLQVTQAVPQAKLCVVHMEAWNHCRLSRAELHQLLQTNNLNERVFVPANGEWFNYPVESSHSCFD